MTKIDGGKVDVDRAFKENDESPKFEHKAKGEVRIFKKKDE